MTIEWAKLILETVLSVPVALILIALIFRKPITQFLPTITKAKVGPIEWERAVEEVGKATELSAKVSKEIAELQILSARSRIYEVEIWLGSFGAMLSEDLNVELKKNVEEMKDAVLRIEEARNAHA